MKLSAASNGQTTATPDGVPCVPNVGTIDSNNSLLEKIKVEAGEGGECEGDDKITEAGSSSRSKSKRQTIRMPQRKGGMQLWQFLYALLEDPEKRYGELIEWTDNRVELEFRLLDPEAIAIWWGNIKHRANMTYERLSRSLRYYYDRGILKKMGGERYLYRFCVDPEEMYRHIGNSDSRPVLKPMPLQVSKWMYSRMVLPHGVYFSPGLAPPDYSTLIQQQQPQQQQTTLQPPPYPGPSQNFHVDPFYLPNSSGYDYLTHISQEAETPFNNLPLHNHYDNTLDLPDPSPYATSTALAGTSFGLMYPTSISPDSIGRCVSFETSQTIPAPITTTDNNQVQFQSTQQLTSSSSSAPIYIQASGGDNHHQLHMIGNVGNTIHSPDHSGGSSCGGGDCDMALDEILPILASMEHSEELTLLDAVSSPNHYNSPSPSTSLPHTPSANQTSFISHSPSFISANYTETFVSWLKTNEYDQAIWNTN
jgi:hypothetical protein